MGFSVVVYLYCNGDSPDCTYQGEEASGGDSPYTTIKEYKEDFKKLGWHFVGHKAYCPDCREHRRKKK